MKTHIALLLLAMMIACSSKPGMENADLTASEAAPVATSNTATAPEKTIDLARMIKTADLRFETGDAKKSAETIQALLPVHDAYISTSKSFLESGATETTMTLRVPSERFDDMIKALEGEAKKVLHKTITTQDVSKEFVDLEARLKVKRTVAQRYEDILEKRTGTIEDILSAEREIGHLQEEIEATIARLNFLSKQVAYSTINVSFFEPVVEQVVDTSAPYLGRLSEAFSAGYGILLDITVGLVYMWPLVLATLAVLAWYRFRRKQTVPFS